MTIDDIKATMNDSKKFKPGEAKWFAMIAWKIQSLISEECPQVQKLDNREIKLLNSLSKSTAKDIKETLTTLTIDDIYTLVSSMSQETFWNKFFMLNQRQMKKKVVTLLDLTELFLNEKETPSQE